MSRRIRLLVVNHTTLFSGAERILCDLLSRLPREEVEVLGVVAPGTGPLVTKLTEIGVQVLDLPVPHLAGVRSPIAFGHGLLRWARFTRQFRGVLQELAPDLVYASSPHAAIAAEPAVTHSRLPWVWEMPDLVRSTVFNRLALRRALRRSDRIVAISKAIAESLRTLGASTDRIELIYAAVDAAIFRRSAVAGAEVRKEFAIPSGAPMVGMFGQITPWKGWHVLVESLPEIAQTHPDVHFLFVGRPYLEKDQVYAAQLRRLVEARGLARAVHWTGFRADVARLMGTCDVVVHASVKAEPLGLVIMEAMAAGAAVVCARGGGTEEIVTDGVTGLVVEPDRPTLVASAVATLLSDPVRRSGMAEQAVEDIASRFTHEHRVLQISELIQEIVRRRRS